MQPLKERNPTSEKQRIVGTTPDCQRLIWLFHYSHIAYCSFLVVLLIFPSCSNYHTTVTSLWSLKWTMGLSRPLVLRFRHRRAPTWSMELLSLSTQAGTRIRLCRIKSQFMISSVILSHIPALPGMQVVASPVLHNKLKPKQVSN